MSGVSLRYDLGGIDRIKGRLARLTGIDRDKILDEIGATVESQTKRRIGEEKKSPAGEKWPEWSPRYAVTRHGGHSLLENEGHLYDDINHLVHGSEVETGTDLVYGATHQFGDGSRNIPARAYLGISKDNEAELEHQVDRFFERAMA